MNTPQQFHNLLQTSADGFFWSAQQVPAVRRILQPPKGLGEWSAARHIFHMVFYERTFALPAMRMWLGEPRPPLSGPDEEMVWREGNDSVESLLAEFMKLREEQLALLWKFDEAAWDTPEMFYSGPATLAWIVSKTFQHTAEHTNDVLRIALFWDMFEAQHKV